MKMLLAATTLFAISAPCFSASCFDSPEYKNSVATAQASNAEMSAQIGKAVDFLTTNKGLDFDHALGEVVHFSTLETVEYDRRLNEVGAKIKQMNPQSPEECSELIKLQRQYEAIGREKVQFIVSKIVGQSN